MKKIILSLTMLSMALGTQAQKIEIGVNGGIYTTWLMNKNVFDQDDQLNPSFSGGPSFGLVGTFYFSDKAGIGAELNFATVNQKYSGDLGGGLTYEAKSTVHYTQIPILLKIKNEGGFYFEVGPQIGLRGKATEEYTSDPSSPFDYSSANVEKGFKSSVFSIAFGFGGRFDLSDKLVLTAGLRLAAGITDATEEYSQTEATELVLTGDSYFGQLGLTDVYAHTTSSSKFKYEKTTLATGGVQLSLVYKIGE